MKNTKLIIAFIIIAIISAGGFYYLKPQSNIKLGAIFSPDDKKLVAFGKKLYANNCASCHGMNLEGERDWKNRNEQGLLPAPPHDETGHTWHHNDETLFSLTKYGLAKTANLKDYKTNMPIYENILSDEKIISIMSYVKSTWPDEIIERHDQLNANQAQQ